MSGSRKIQTDPERRDGESHPANGAESETSSLVHGKTGAACRAITKTTKKSGYLGFARGDIARGGAFVTFVPVGWVSLASCHAVWEEADPSPPLAKGVTGFGMTASEGIQANTTGRFVVVRVQSADFSMHGIGSFVDSLRRALLDWLVSW